MPENPEHAIRCPWCQTPAGARCTTQRGRTLPIPSHQARIDAWTTAPRNADDTTGPSGAA